MTSSSVSQPVSAATWLLHVDDPESETELGTLRGHMAKQNPQAKVLVEHVAAETGWETEEDVMVLFTSL
jgi:transcriptional regulator